MKGPLELGDELLTIRRAVEGVRRLTEAALPEYAENDRTARSSTQAAVAVANLVSERLRAVERATRGVADPAELVTEYNVTIEGADGGARLNPWSSAKQRQEAERVLRKIRHEQRTAGARRRRR